MRKVTHILALFGLMSIGVGCSTAKEMTISVMEPSPVAITNHIKTIGVIDATRPVTTKTSEEGNLDAIAANDERWLSINGTGASIHGLFEALSEDKRFENIKLINQTGIAKNLSEEQLDPTTWNQIKALCDQNGVDAIFALAHFDVDTKLTVKKATITQIDLMRVGQRTKGQEITMETLIENGWRIFDPEKRELIDEIVTNDQLVTTSQGSDLQEAFNNMGGHRQSALAFSKNTGTAYGQRLLPSERIIQRKYFAKGNRSLVEADKFIQEGKIDQAISKLELAVEGNKPEVSSKASYNLAVINEYQGDLEEAVRWTLKSIELKSKPFNNDYLENLRKRQAKNVLLHQQYLEIGALD